MSPFLSPLVPPSFCSPSMLSDRHDRCLQAKKKSSDWRFIGSVLDFRPNSSHALQFAGRLAFPDVSLPVCRTLYGYPNKECSCRSMPQSQATNKERIQTVRRLDCSLQSVSSNLRSACLAPRLTSFRVALKISDSGAASSGIFLRAAVCINTNGPVRRF
jgi:hypothetical protein